MSSPPTRDDRAKQARSAGDKDLAERIHQLAKPNLVAWLANQLAREHTDEIRPLFELGDALREATATLSGEQIRDLSRRRRPLIFALVQQARQLAIIAWRKASDETARGLDDTLGAALADPDAAAALAAGRLTEGMQNRGFGGIPGRDERSEIPANEPTAATPPSPTPRQRTPEQTERAEHDVEQAKSAVSLAMAARQRTHDDLEAADQTLAETAARVERVRRELDEGQQAHVSAEKDRARAGGLRSCRSRRAGRTATARRGHRASRPLGDVAIGVEPHRGPTRIKKKAKDPGDLSVTNSSRTAPARVVTHWLLAVVVAAGLAVDAYVHWNLAPDFDDFKGTASPHISQGQLFRVEAALALVAMLLVLLTRNRLGAAVAFLIAAGGLGAVLLYAYVDVGGFGPLPDMYDPIWYPKKTISAVAEAVAALGSITLFMLRSRAAD